MPISQKIFFSVIALAVFTLILELVRRRKLSEHYSWMWMLIAFSFFLLIIEFHAIRAISDFLMIVPTSFIIFMSLIALALLILQLSIASSLHARQIKNMAQKIALLEEKTPGK